MISQQMSSSWNTSSVGFKTAIGDNESTDNQKKLGQSKKVSFGEMTLTKSKEDLLRTNQM
jgi:hypothetical protein